MTVLTLLMPSTARADVLLTPFAGVTFIDENTNGTFGASVSVGSLIGFELDVSRTRLGTFRDVPVVDLTLDVTTAMGNLMVRLPLGPVQPYASGGAGLIILSGNVRAPFLGSVLSASARDVGVNVGGGVHVFPSRHIGIRGDVRYFRTVGNVTIGRLADIGSLNDLPLPRVDFWRATGGVTFRF